MGHSCQLCKQVGESLAQALTATVKADRRWKWKADLHGLVKSAVADCEFAHFVDYVLLQPWYSHKIRTPLESSGNPRLFLDRANKNDSRCIVCSKDRIGKLHDLICFRCLPRVARAISDAIKRLACADDPLFDPKLAVELELSFEIDDYYPGSLYIRLVNAASDYGTAERAFTMTATAIPALDMFRPERDYDLSSLRASEQLKFWLTECDNHGCEPSSKGVPKRLLDVSTASSGVTRLVEGNHCHGRYVALSYCWGGDQPFSTRMCNLESYSRGITIGTLPATIRDAIQIVHQLGIQYLWVDSLCIVQDSLEDKIGQIAAMDQVYMNAYLTISASRAKKCDEGFIHRQACSFHFDIPQNLGVEALRNLKDLDMIAQKDRSNDIACRIPCPLTTSGLSFVTLRRRVAYELALEPVSRRAWTYQERLLSPRLVNFGKCLTWLCPQKYDIDPCTGDLWSPNRGDRINLSRSNRDWITTNVSKETEVLMSLWQDIVVEYSNRQTSLTSDKLPAMAGLAKRFKQFKKDDQYLAGLWHSHIPHDLIWFLQSSGERPKDWRAPTWSWASIDGCVRFYSGEDTINGQDSLVQVLSYDSQLTNIDAPFGEIASASMTVRGRIGKTSRTLYTYHEPRQQTGPVTVVREILCVPETLSSDPYSTSYQETQRIFIDEEKDKMMTQKQSDQIVVDGWTDGKSLRLPKVLESKSAWLLPIRGLFDFDLNASMKHSDCHTRIDGLLLEPVDQNVYRRIGIFEILKFDPAEYVEWSEVHDIRLV